MQEKFKGLGRGRWRIHPNQHLEMLTLYSGGLTVKAVAKRYEVNPRTVATILSKHGITPRAHQLYEYRPDFFRNIDTPEKAYFLGLMLTDGTVERNERTAKITLQDRDAYILERFAKEVFCGSRPLGEDFSDHNRLGPRRRKKFVLKLCCGPLVKDLIRLGCIPNKSLVLQFPARVLRDEKILWHFIRGLIDGDGCLHLKRGSYLEVSFVGSCRMVKALRLVLKRRGIETAFSPHGRVMRMQVKRVNQSQSRFLELLYRESEGLRLERKHSKYLEASVSRQIRKIHVHNKAGETLWSFDSVRACAEHFQCPTSTIKSRYNGYGNGTEFTFVREAA